VACIALLVLRLHNLDTTTQAYGEEHVVTIFTLIVANVRVRSGTSTRVSALRCQIVDCSSRSPDEELTAVLVSERKSFPDDKDYLHSAEIYQLLKHSSNFTIET
jgi:hypothetical protein